MLGYLEATSPLVWRIVLELQYDRILTLSRFYPEFDYYKHTAMGPYTQTIRGIKFFYGLIYSF